MSALDWPEGFDRTPPSDREPYPHGFRLSLTESIDSILEQLRKMDARNVQLETSGEHQVRNPNKPYADAEFDDPGVVVYFERDGVQFAVPCDRWDNPRDNARAIALYLDAKRALERYGVETVDSEFATQALPSGDEDREAVVGQEPPHDVLGVAPDADPEVVKAAARQLKKKYHPDRDGDLDEFKRIVRAEEKLLGEGSA